MKVAHLSFAIGLAAMSAGIATPAFAQQVDEDIVVEGHYGPLPDNVQTASQAVSYADLDLSYPDDRRELRRRLDLTARYLCDRLGESDSSSSIAPSCRQAAVRDALARVGTVEAHWAPRGTAWVASSRWQAPYPRDWEARYPASNNGY